MDVTPYSSSRWERLEELFAAALEKPSERLEEFLDHETVGDPELARELRSLLAHDSLAKDRIRQAISSAARPPDWPGRRAGPYRIVREIGHGGMGQVFEAVRDDDEYRKTVALKMAPWWRDRDLLSQRFRQERQILSGLEHPNIARFLDGGTHEGIPYFAMEFVEGRPIDQYAAALTLRQKIELFRVVCGAVEYAHQSLVVHRDLKPANILVTGEGVPKLLDFGIAKLVTPFEEDGAATRMPIWTPDYASPEQVRGQAVTTRTDVYSLGLVLFEILTGAKAQVAETSSPLSLDRSICETEPPLASQRAIGRGYNALARQLSGDLDSIIATALRKEPERRYSSVAAFSRDLERYLDGEPIKARPGGFAYRAGKFLCRHLAASVAALLIVLAISGGALATLYQARRAEHRFQQVRHLANSVLLGVPDRLQNLAGATETQEWAVRTAMEYLDDLAKDAGRDQSMLTELAGGYLKVGDVQGYPLLPNLGHRDAALSSYRKAEAFAERAVAANPDAEARRLVAQSHQRIGAVLRTMGQTDTSLTEYQQALSVAEPLYVANPGNANDAELLATILLTLGQAQSATGNIAEASRLWLRTAEVRERSAIAAGGDSLETRRARTQKYVIRALVYAGDLEAAERTAIEGVAVREELAARQPANAAFRRELGNSYGDLGYVYFHPSLLSLDDREKAAIYQRKSLAIAKELAAADPHNATAQSDLSITEIDLCGALIEIAPAAAVGYCRDSVELAAHWPQVNAAGGLSPLAEGLAKLGRRQEAMQALEKAIGMWTDLHRQDPSHFVVRQQLLRDYNQMASLLLEMGDADAARKEHLQAIGLAEELAAAIPTNLLARRDLADTYEGLGKFFEGRDWAQSGYWYQKSLDLWNAWPAMAHSGRMDQARRVRAQQLASRAFERAR